jgi:excisionase family DNA binding protein
MDTNPTPLVRVDWVAKRLGATNQQIYRLCRKDKIPYVRFGLRGYRFDIAQIEIWIANGGARHLAKKYPN